MITPAITAFTVTTGLGRGNGATVDALRAGRGALRPNTFLDSRPDVWTAEVAGLDDVRLPEHLARFDCRSNRLFEAALREDGFDAALAAARERHGAGRIGVYVGTSSAGILEIELGYRARDRASGALPQGLKYREAMNLFSPADYVLERFGLDGPAVVISAACASSAKAFAAAARALAAGVCDAAVVGGVETLCLTTLYGFGSLNLLSGAPCRPCDTERDGISLGEGAGFALLERSAADQGAIRLLGYGESTDAHHLSTPHPEGRGAAMAMRAALAMAGCLPQAVDYVNLHGTGTRTNDVAEDAAIRAVLGSEVRCSSTKGYTGHTLGAAGIVEAVITLLAMRERLLPGTLNCAHVDPAIGARVLTRTIDGDVRCAASNSFGFGGSNCTLLFGAAPS